MPAYTLNELLTLDDPAVSWMFRVRMPIVAGNFLSSMHIEEINLPFTNTTGTGRFSAGSKNFYPEATDISSVSITFYEDRNFTVMNYLLNWRSLVVNPTSYYYGLPSVYKQPIEWEIYNGVTNIPVMVGLLEGCWPLDITPFNLQFGSSDRIKVVHNFSVDTSKVLITSPKALLTNVALDALSFLNGGALPSTSDVSKVIGDSITGVAKSIF